MASFGFLEKRVSLETTLDLSPAFYIPHSEIHAPAYPPNIIAPACQELPGFGCDVKVF